MGVAMEEETAVAGKCPICGKPTQTRYRPFCSKRCADVDLQRWLTGGYAFPVMEEDDAPEEDEEGERRHPSP